MSSNTGTSQNDSSNLTESRRVMWRKNSSQLPGSIKLISSLSDLSLNLKDTENNKHSDKDQNPNNREFFNYVFTNENWIENILTGTKLNEETCQKQIIEEETNIDSKINNNNKSDNTDNNIKNNIENFDTTDNSKNNNKNNDNINTTDTTNSINNINNNKNSNNEQENTNKSLRKSSSLSNTSKNNNNLSIIPEDTKNNDNNDDNTTSTTNIKKIKVTDKEKSTMQEDSDYPEHKIKQFEELLNSPNIDLAQLKKLAWSGIPKRFRPMSWQLLMGYLPRNQDRREVTLARKRKDFADTANQAFSKGIAGLDYTLYHQIHIDIPRTNPSCSIYQNEKIQKSLERILYCWAIRHPASGYVQGINDLVTPFYYVFLSSYIDGDLETYDLSKISDDVFEAVEADSFWCLTNLLDGIQDSYTYAQPGIHRQVQKLEEFIKRINLKLYNHLKKEDVQFIQFAFRWMNCLLMRELKLEHTIRMWDTYQSEPDGFSEFHLYVCASFLNIWSDKLLEMDFQDIMIFLQNLPTSEWSVKDIEMLLSEAYMWKCLFHDSPSHIS